MSSSFSVPSWSIHFAQLGNVVAPSPTSNSGLMTMGEFLRSDLISYIESSRPLNQHQVVTNIRMADLLYVCVQYHSPMSGVQFDSLYHGMIPQFALTVNDFKYYASTSSVDMFELSLVSVGLTCMDKVITNHHTITSIWWPWEISLIWSTRAKSHHIA